MCLSIHTADLLGMCSFEKDGCKSDFGIHNESGFESCREVLCRFKSSWDLLVLIYTFPRSVRTDGVCMFSLMECLYSNY